MRLAVLFSALLLSACAVDDYHPLPGAPVEHQASILRDCKNRSIKAYLHERSMDVDVVAGGLIGGAAGGGLVSLLKSGEARKIDRMVESCMRQNGFEGHSEN